MTQPMTQHEITVARAEDDDRFLATDNVVWFDEVSSAPTEVRLHGLPAEHRFAADVPGSDPVTYPGVYGVYPMTLMVPTADQGTGPVPCAGLTWVGVHPDHRRKGVLTAMIRHHLEETHARGVAVSALHASEPAIYGRYGYGLASLEHEVTLSRGTTLTAPHLDDDAALVTTRWSTVSDADVPARMHDCHSRVAELGAVVGAPEYYERVCLQLPEQQVTRGRDGYELSYRPPLPVEGWNAQISLMTGMAAAELMLTWKVGILRTVPEADPKRLARLRRTAVALDVRPVLGAFGLTDARILSPGDPYGSVMYYRLAKVGPGRMPHAGSQVTDSRGLDLIHDWIISLAGKKGKCPQNVCPGRLEGSHAPVSVGAMLLLLEIVLASRRPSASKQREGQARQGEPQGQQHGLVEGRQQQFQA